jgi:hypothetical protein
MCLQTLVARGVEFTSNRLVCQEYLETHSGHKKISNVGFHSVHAASRRTACQHNSCQIRPSTPGPRRVSHINNTLWLATQSPLFSLCSSIRRLSYLMIRKSVCYSRRFQASRRIFAPSAPAPTTILSSLEYR